MAFKIPLLRPTLDMRGTGSKSRMCRQGRDQLDRGGANLDSVLSDILVTCIYPGVVMVALSLAASEIGYRIGRRLKAGADNAMRWEIYTLQAATLALLALLLGFSFSLGASAFENRRRVILNEASVIAKAHKRADLLPEPTRSEVHELLIQYIDTRLGLFYQGAFRERVVRAKLHESQRLQARRSGNGR